MTKPTPEEYEKSKEAYKNYCSWLRMTREKKNELIDALAQVRKDEIDYLKQAEHYHEIVQIYEIYEQVEKGGAE